MCYARNNCILEGRKRRRWRCAEMVMNAEKAASKSGGAASAFSSLNIKSIFMTKRKTKIDFSSTIKFVKSILLFDSMSKNLTVLYAQFEN